MRDCDENIQEDISELINIYFENYPHEAERISYLRDYVTNKSKQGDRLTLVDLIEENSPERHLTASAILLTQNGEVFQIHHKAMSKWLQPGGHSESNDKNPYHTALRELNEEAGLSDVVYAPILANNEIVPFDIDVHEIPANPRKNKSLHWHIDFRYVFFVPDSLSTVLQLEEVTDYRYQKIEKLLQEDPSSRLFNKLEKFIRDYKNN